jgi:hypothetical protein
MSSDTDGLTQAVPSSTAADASHSLQIVPEKLAEHTIELGEAIAQFVAPTAPNEAAEAFGHRFEKVAHSLEQIYQDPIIRLSRFIRWPMRASVGISSLACTLLRNSSWQEPRTRRCSCNSAFSQLSSSFSPNRHGRCNVNSQGLILLPLQFVARTARPLAKLFDDVARV